MKFYLDTIGCRLNQSEIEKIASDLRAGGHSIVENASEADAAIVNTCTVTAAASADSRKVIRRIAKTGCTQIYATGCYATIDPESVTELPSVVRQYKNEDKGMIAADFIDEDFNLITPEPVRIPLPGRRKRTRAFIKIQDGCDNLCTFCITRIARGKSRSINEREIFSDIKSALLGGAKEIVLTGVNLSSWGMEFGKNQTLPILVMKIIHRYSPKRLRLSSVEPWDIDENYFSILNHPSFCKHLHIPLQAGVDKTLHRMGRRNTVDEYKKTINTIRKNTPMIAITTDIIVGFPGESDQDFKGSLEFVRQMDFSSGHIFRYSCRSGTPAEKMVNQVPEIVKKKRSAEMQKVIDQSAMAYKERFLNQVVSVLWEKSTLQRDGEFLLSGLTSNYLRVQANSKNNIQNSISEVTIDGFRGKKLHGILA